MENPNPTQTNPTPSVDTMIAVKTTESVMTRLLETADVERVYGAPYEKDGYAVIPAAEVLTSMGFGSGYGEGSGPQSEVPEKPQGQGSGGGGGGGGYALSRPVAVIIATPDRVYVEPVVDVTKVALAALTAFGFIATTLLKMMRGPGGK